MDQQYLITVVQLPPGSSLSRTDEVIQKVLDKSLKIDGVEDAVSFTGIDPISFTNASNSAVVFQALDDFEVRKEKGIEYEELMQTVRTEMMQIDDALVLVIPPPPINGIGNAGGFKMMIQDRSNVGTNQLLEAVYALAAAANEDPILTNVFTFYNNQTPQLFLDIDRVKAEKLDLNIQDVFQSLEIYMGSVFVNEFNYLGRTFQVDRKSTRLNSSHVRISYAVFCLKKKKKIKKKVYMKKTKKNNKKTIKQLIEN